MREEKEEIGREEEEKGSRGVIRNEKKGRRDR